MRYLSKLRRAGVPVLWSRTIVAAEGDGRLERCAMRRSPRTASRSGGETPRRSRPMRCASATGSSPRPRLARALGCAHRLVDRHLGYLATETGTDGASSLSGVFVVGDGADLGGARVALARGTLAGIAAAARLGYADRDPDEQRRAARDLAPAERFQARALVDLPGAAGPA